MNAVLNQLGTTLGWLFAFAPLLLVGLVMAAEPYGFRSLCSSLCHDFAEGVRRFDDQLHHRWPRLPSHRIRQLLPKQPAPW